MLKEDIGNFVKYFEEHGRLEKGCNSSFITLIPKIKDPLKLGDYRPISLIESLYKIISKILATRLKKVIGTNVNEVQSAYVQGRNIQDDPLIVNEICSWAKKTKNKLLLFKVDFDKAFDSVNWKYLDQIQEQMGYGDKWRMWIRGCLGSARASVLVNGSPTREFKMEKGVRQGDPLSPFLLILAMEGLNVAMESVCDKGVFKGFKVPRENFTVSHIFYADDALFIGEWNEQNIKNLARILRCFHVASGLKVNFNKSRATPLGCEPSSLPFTYLGVPVGANMNLKKFWKPVIDKFQSKLSSWKAQNLSLGGRLTLTKNVLGSLPSYYFSLFVAPVGVVNTLEKIRRNFLWGGLDEQKNIRWVAWNKVVVSKENGGLGLGSLRAYNLAMIVKWWWRMRCNKSAMWSRVIIGIHNLKNKPPERMSMKSMVGVWNNIAGVQGELRKSGVELEDVMSTEGVLKDRFHALYQLEKEKMCTVRDRIGTNGHTWNWRADPTAGTQVSHFNELLHVVGIHQVTAGEDRWRCTSTDDGDYHVSMLRHMLDVPRQETQPSEVVKWTRDVPIKVMCFIWRAIQGRIPTNSALGKRGIQIEDFDCGYCLQGVED
ncbi:hypothetical protein LXL04_014158 [Taraxacum kok-saghyz]